jgi:hypothetical protein
LLLEAVVVLVISAVAEVLVACWQVMRALHLAHLTL